MKRNVCALAFFSLLFSLIFSLSGCRCQHAWSNATCISPMICSMCGEISGTASGHSWLSATCTTPNTCSVCGITEGSSLGHNWSGATCIAPAKCSVCNENSNTLGDHQWVAATYEHPKYCSLCNLEDGLPLLDSTDIRYVLAACAYRAVLEDALVPSSVVIERARYTDKTDSIPLPIVVLECSVDNALGGKSTIRCYAYKAAKHSDIEAYCPSGAYLTFTHHPSEAESYTIYCRTIDISKDTDPLSYFDWEHLNSDLIITRYTISLG